MSGYLPYGGFKWIKNVDNFDVNSISENIPAGYILKVHLDYVTKLTKLIMYFITEVFSCFCF